MPNKEKISVVIPAFNEAAVIGSTVKKVADFFNQANWPHEIIVVDDGSTDDTAEIAAAAGARILINKINRGKGFSVKRGVETASGELILFSDADLSTPIEEINKLAPDLADYDIIIGSRAMAGSQIEISQSRLKVEIGQLGNFIIRLFLGLPWADTQCGFKLFKRKTLPIFQQQTINRWGFDFELLFIARRFGYKIKEAGVRWRNDGTSTVTLGGYFQTLVEVFKVRLNSWRGKYK